MDQSLKKRLKWGSIIAFIISLALMIFAILYTRIDTDYILFNSLNATILSASVITALISLRFENTRIFRRIILILTIFLPVYVFITLAPEKWIYIESDLGMTLLTIGFVLSSAAAAIYVFIINKPDSVNGLLIIIFYLILCFVLSRIYTPASDVTYVFGFFVFGPGMVMFGVRTLLILQKNTFLKVVTSLVCLLIYLISWEFIWINPVSAEATFVIYSVLAFLITFIVLLSLPFSGYIQWDDLHKKILKKLILPWVFILLVVSLRFIFPDMSNVLFSEKQNNVQEFGMRDYEIINKNGLEPEKVK